MRKKRLERVCMVCHNGGLAMRCTHRARTVRVRMKADKARAVKNILTIHRNDIMMDYHYEEVAAKDLPGLARTG